MNNSTLHFFEKNAPLDSPKILGREELEKSSHKLERVKSGLDPMVLRMPVPLFKVTPWGTACRQWSSIRRVIHRTKLPWPYALKFTIARYKAELFRSDQCSEVAMFLAKYGNNQCSEVTMFLAKIWRSYPRSQFPFSILHQSIRKLHSDFIFDHSIDPHLSVP